MRIIAIRVTRQKIINSQSEKEEEEEEEEEEEAVAKEIQSVSQRNFFWIGQ